MTAARHSTFHRLRVAGVERITDDAVAVTLEVPADLRARYRFTPGQHLTLRRRTGEEEVRRTYSVCDAAPAPDGGWPPDGGPATLRVGVRLVEGGAFSPYAVKKLLAGDELDVMTPAGRFGLGGLELPDGDGGSFAAVVGGSGITPVLSIARTLLTARPAARFCLLRGDRTAASTMFLDETADLKDRFPGRFQLVQALSREERESGLSGRLDVPRLTALLPALLAPAAVDAWFLCGPHGLVSGTEQALRTLGVERSRVHQEIFHVDDAPAAAPAAAAPDTTAAGTVRAVLGGRSGAWPARAGESLLETVLRNRADAPYACKGGVCGTCRARVTGGEVRMDRNFALEPEELAAGYVLACQSHPVTAEVSLDFDA